MRLYNRATAKTSLSVRMSLGILVEFCNNVGYCLNWQKKVRISCWFRIVVGMAEVTDWMGRQLTNRSGKSSWRKTAIQRRFPKLQCSV